MPIEDDVFMLQVRNLVGRLRDAGRENEANALRYAVGVATMSLAAHESGITMEDAEALSEALNRLRLAVLGIFEELPKVDEPAATGAGLN